MNLMDADPDEAGYLGEVKPAPPAVKIRWRWSVAGGHIHVRVFVGTGDTLALSGTLVFRAHEWEAIALNPGLSAIEFVPEAPSLEF